MTRVLDLIRSATTFLLSPTLVVIGRLKRRAPERRTKLLTVWSWFFSALILLIAIVLMVWSPTSTAGRAITFIPIGLLAWSRTNEIVFAFVKDGADTLEKRPRVTTFTPVQRIRFVAICYLEILLNFGFLYLGAQSLAEVTDNGKAFVSTIPGVFESIYLSSSIMTTLGYGDYAPSWFLTKTLSIYEVLSGLILFVFALAVYAGAEYERPPT